jgi:hypothetical protein
MLEPEVKKRQLLLSQTTGSRKATHNKNFVPDYL